MPTSSGSSYFNRLVHNTRQAVTRRKSRRLAEPTGATPTPDPYTGPHLSPIDVFTSSNALGMFDNNDVPMTFTYRPPETPYHAQSHDINTEPGPSHFYTYIQPENPANSYISAWTTDFTGQDVYVGHGKLEEVGSDEVEDGAHHDSSSRSRVLGPLSSLNAGDHESNELLNDELAYLTTPPPCPRPRKLPSLRSMPTGSDFMSAPAITTTGATSSLAPLLDEHIEVHLVTNNLVLVESSLEDVQFMNTLFLANSDEHDLSEHIDLCAHIEESLESLRGTLTLRTQIGAEEWSVRSHSWNQKYGNRLLSLKRTLQRLARLRQLIESHSHSLRSHQRTAIRTKLEQHEAKLADLASKYSAAFDRLRLRHLHFLLKQSHDQSHDAHQRRKTQLASRKSFERRWAEGKILRAGLRVNFHDQRDYLYNNKSQLRPGRQTSAQ